jgi:PAS domain S-box-containing protein
MQRMLMLQHHVSDSLHRLQTISDNVLEAIITIDSSATIISCNRAVESLFGWTVSELLGQNVKVLCPEPYRTEHDAYVYEYVSGGPPRIIGLGREVPAQRKDGTSFAAELTVSEVRQAGKRIFIGVLRDISERKRAENLLKENAEKLQRYYESTESENQLAHTLIERQLLREDLDDPLVHYWLTPAENFSGDVIAATRSSSGRLYAVLADATGHGLTAAISTLPVLTLFYRMAAADTPLQSMVSEINQQLRESMPVGRFVGATFVCLDTTKHEGSIWIGGMPSTILLDGCGSLIREFVSKELPLGILSSTEINTEPAQFSWKESCQLALCSDGLLEAESSAGDPFGQHRFLAAIAGLPVGNRRDHLQTAVLSHIGDGTAQDDISLLTTVLPGFAIGRHCRSKLAAPVESVQAKQKSQAFDLAFSCARLSRLRQLRRLQPGLQQLPDDPAARCTPSEPCHRRGNRTSGYADSRRCDWQSVGQTLQRACQRFHGHADGRTRGDGSPASASCRG